MVLEMHGAERFRDGDEDELVAIEMHMLDSNRLSSLAFSNISFSWHKINTIGN